MSKQSDFDKCLMSQLEGYRKKIHGENFSPRQKELFPGLKRDLNMEIEDAASSDDPLEACMERRGYKPSKTQVFQEAISAKLTADMFGKQEKLTGAEAMFQEQMQECLDKLKTRPKLKFGADIPQWKYSEYSNWSKLYAKDNTIPELEKELHKLEKEQGKNTESHLRSINKTTSMQSQSQRRAHAGNVVTGNYERRRAIEDAIEIHRYYPERAKGSIKKIAEKAGQMTLFGRITDSLPPILGWVGGKTKLADKIISMMPEHKVYVEPFLGGGSVFFKKPLADVNVINDLDKNLINFYKGVRNGGCEKIRACKMPRNRTEFNRAVENKGTDICSYLGISKRGYGGDLNYPRFSDQNAKRGHNATNFRQKCDRYKDKLKQARVLNKDYKDVLKEYDSKDTLCYIDPPYSERDHYGHGKINPEDVAKLVKSMKGKAIVSYNNHPRVRKAFAGLNFHKVKTRYSIQTGATKNISELLITNF